MKRNRTDDLLNFIGKWIEDEGNEITISQLLGYLLYRVNYMTDKKMSELGSDIYLGDCKNEDISVNEAICLMHTLTLSKEQMRILKQFMAHKNIDFPNTTQILQERLKLQSPITPILENKGVSVDYRDSVICTTKSTLEIVSEERMTPFTSQDEIKMYFKDGCDGSGQHNIWKSKSMIDAQSNIFLYGYIPLRLECNNVVIWKNSTPNSTRSLRPIYLIREKENNQELLNTVISKTDSIRSELNDNGICIFSENNPLNIKINIQDTMKDLKLKKIISGLGGADCILCKSKQDDWMTTISYHINKYCSYQTLIISISTDTFLYHNVYF